MLTGAFGKHARDVVLDSALMKRGVFDRDYISGLFRGQSSGRRGTRQAIWALFNLTAGYECWIDHAPVFA